MSDFISNLSIPELITFVVLILGLSIQLFYYLFVFSKVGFFFNKKNKMNVTFPVSVIICAKNEEENLRNFLPFILHQNYPNFEVVVINDCSEDGTETVLAELEQSYKKLRHSNIEFNPNFRHGKKLAISIGIKSANYEHLVFTDADCHPVSDLWLQSLMNSYNENSEMVLGYGKYESKKGLLNKFIRLDTFFIGLQYLGMAMLKKPYMGVGRNLSYKKNLFFEGKGFSSHYHILSGDDDLFVNEHSNKKNTSVCFDKNSFTCSLAPKSFKEWIAQKKRHFSTSRFYKFSDKFLLTLEPFGRLLFYVALIILLFTPLYIIGLYVYLFRLIVQGVVVKLGMNKLNENGFLLLLPFFDIFFPIFQLFLLRGSRKNAKLKIW